jgi:hypothetical protein
MDNSHTNDSEKGSWLKENWDLAGIIAVVTVLTIIVLFIATNTR